MQKELFSGKVGELGTWSVKLDGIDAAGAVKVKVGFLSLAVDVGVPGKDVLELIKKLIPGSVDDALIDMLEAKFANPAV